MWRRFVHHSNETLSPAVTKSNAQQQGKRSKDNGTQTEETDLPAKSSDDEEQCEEKRGFKTYKTFCKQEAAQLLKRPWQLCWIKFHGLMPRNEIEPLLQKDGDFLIRKTEVGRNERIAISYKWLGQARHMLFKLDENNRWILRNECSFDSIEKLVLFYMSEFKQDGSKLLTPINRPDWYLLHEHIALKKKLGSGSFGDVFLAELMQEDKKIEVAAKTLHGKMSKQDRANFVREASLNRRLNHPNIVRLIGIASQCEPLMVVLELAPNGSLKNHVRENVLLSATLTKYLLDAAKGLEYLAKVGIIHRDVAARNCLMSANMTVKISDFGLSVATKELKELKLQKVPIRWLAPETLRLGNFSFKTDVWSYGVMMWELYSHCETDPYPGLTNAKVKQAILNGQLMQPPPAMPEFAVKLMKVCWHENPDERPSFNDIIRRLDFAKSISTV